MSEATAVAEPEVTDTQAATPESTQDTSSTEDEVTETQATVQTEPTEGETQADEEDPTEVAIRSRVEAELETERERVREEETQRLFTEARQAEAQQAQAALRQSFTTALRNAGQTLDNLMLADGLSERKLTPAERAAVLSPFEEYNRLAVQAAQTEAFGQITDAIYASLPKDSHADFTKAANQKPLKEYLDTYAETRALSTKAVKGMTLEEATKTSSKLKAEIDSLKATEYERGRKNPKPAGEPPIDGRGSGGVPSISQWQGMTLEQRVAARQKDPDIEIKMMGMVPS